MGLSLSYIKGKNFKTSFFVAKEGINEYKVSASEVLPLVVQSAIQSNDPNVISPVTILEDLKSKYSTINDFKRWAKRRKGKNKKVELSLLVHPQWLAGSPKQDASGQPYGGSARDDVAATARWDQER